MMMQRGRRQRDHPWRTESVGVTSQQIKVGAVFDGVVTWGSHTSGVFVDFGGLRDGYLRMRSRYRGHYVKGTQVNGMTVVEYDPTTGKTILEPSPESMPEQMGRARSRSSSFASNTRSRNSTPRSGSPRSDRSKSPYARSTSATPSARSSRGTSREPLPRWKRDWEHPEGVPLEEIQEGKVVDGVVTRSNRYGVFVDFGCVKDGRLLLARGMYGEFKIGDKVDDIVIDMVDVLQRRVDLALSDLDSTLEALARERVPLEDLEEGMLVDGVICNTGPFGVFVNIGAVKDGKLRVPRRIELTMLSGEQVQGMRIVSIDLEKQRFALVFDRGDVRRMEAPQARRALPPPEGMLPVPAAARQSKAVPKASAKQASTRRAVAALPPPQEPEEPLETAGIPLEDIQVGELADGIVVTITARGVMVDIGAATLGTLRLSEELRQRFQINDMVEGMVVEEVDLNKRQVFLSMDDPELAVMDGGRSASPSSEEAAPVPRREPGRAGETGKARAHSKGRAKAKVG